MPVGDLRHLILGLMLLVVAGCEPALPSNEVDSSNQLIDSFSILLERRAESLSTNDQDGFLEHVAGEARRTEERIGSGFPAIEGRSPSYEVHEETFELDTANSFRMETTFTYRYPGLSEENRFSIPIGYRVSDGETLRIVESTPRAPLPLWATGPVSVAGTEHLLALARPGTEGVDEALAEAEVAYRKLRIKLPSWQEERVLVVLAGNPADFDALTGGEEAEIGGSAIVRTTVGVSKEGFEVRGRHMVVNIPQLAEEHNGPQTFGHELAHLALAELTRPTTPGWLTEGAAMYLAGTRQTAAWESALQKGDFDSVDIATLSTVAQLGAGGSQAGPTVEYAYSNAVIWYLVETFGEARLWELYASFSSRPPEELYDALASKNSGGPDRTEALRSRLTEQALQNVYGLSAEELDRRTKVWLTR